MKEIEKRYRTADGREFDDPRLAKRHEAMVEARQRLEEAQRHFRKVFAETLVTADREPFDFGKWKYHLIRNRLLGIPDVYSVTFDRWRFEYRAENGKTVLLAWNEKERKYIPYPINELYAIERNAQVACLALALERSKDIAEDVAAMAQRYGLAEKSE